MCIASDEKILYTVKEVSELIHTNQAYVYTLIKTGLLPALKPGSYKVRKSALEDFLYKVKTVRVVPEKPHEIRENERSQVSVR